VADEVTSGLSTSGRVGARSRSTSMAGRWRWARILDPIYLQLSRHTHHCPPPHRSLEAGQRTEPEVLAETETWFDDFDRGCTPEQLLALLERAELAATENVLHALIDRFASRPEPSAADLDKLDLLLLAYFRACAPPSFHGRTVSTAELKEVFEPILGAFSTPTPGWINSLEELKAHLRTCASLRELDEQGLVDHARELRNATGPLYFEPQVLFAFTEFNYLLSVERIRMATAEIKTTISALDKLRGRRVEFLDLASAGLSHREPITSLLQTLEGWSRTTPSDPRTLKQLLALRHAVEACTGAIEDERVKDLTKEVAELRQLTQWLFTRVLTLSDSVKRLEGRQTLRSERSQPSALPTPLENPRPQPTTAGEPFPMPQAAITPPQPNQFTTDRSFVRPEVFRSRHNETRNTPARPNEAELPDLEPLTVPVVGARLTALREPEIGEPGWDK